MDEIEQRFYSTLVRCIAGVLACAMLAGSARSLIDANLTAKGFEAGYQHDVVEGSSSTMWRKVGSP